jgi:hypothetical protein
MSFLTLGLPPLSVILRRILLEDWSLKFLSLILAVLMWVYIDGELTDIREFTVPLRAADLSMPEGWDVAPGRPMPKVTVRLRGPRRRLSLVNAEMIHVQQKVVVEQPQAGRNVLRVPLDSMVAQGFDTVGISPQYFDSEIAVELAQIVTQSNGKPQILRMKLPVRPLPPAGAAMKVDPAELEVEISVGAAVEQADELIKNIVLIAEWPAQWGTTEATGAPMLQPVAVQVRALTPSQYTITGIDGSPLPSVQARGVWVPGLDKPATEKPQPQ